MEEAESGALSLEDTGDFTSRLAALSTSRTGTSVSTSRTGTSVGDKGTDLEDSGMVNGGMERQKRSNEDGVSHGETSISEQIMSVQQGDKGDQIDEQREAFTTSSERSEGVEEEGEPSDQKDKMQIVSEEKVQQVVDAIQDSFLQILETGKEDLVEKQGSVKAKQVKKEEKNVGSSGQIEDTA